MKKPNINMVISSFILLFALVSVFFGIMNYRAVSSHNEKIAVLDSLPFTMALTGDYEWVKPREDGNFDAIAGDTNYVTDMNGKLLNRFDENGYEIGDGCMRYRDENGNERVENSSGEVIADNLHCAYSFCDGFCLTVKNSQYKIINTDGEIIYAPKDVIEVFPVGGPLYLVSETEKCRIYNVKTKEFRDLTFFTRIIQETEDGQYSAIVKVKDYISAGDCYVLLDENFDIKENGQLYREIDRLSEGLRYVERFKDTFYKSESGHIGAIEKGYVNAQGKMILPLPKDAYRGFDFSEGKALIYGKTKIQIIDKSGKTLAEIPVKKGSEDDMAGLCEKNNAISFEHGIAPVFLDKKYGVIDENGNMLIEPVFEDIDRAKDGLYTVSVHEKWGNRCGIIDLKTCWKEVS